MQKFQVGDFCRIQSNFTNKVGFANQIKIFKTKKKFCLFLEKLDQKSSKLKKLETFFAKILTKKIQNCTQKNVDFCNTTPGVRKHGVRCLIIFKKKLKKIKKILKKVLTFALVYGSIALSLDKAVVRLVSDQR